MDGPLGTTSDGIKFDPHAGGREEKARRSDGRDDASATGHPYMSYVELCEIQAGLNVAVLPAAPEVIRQVATQFGFVSRVDYCPCVEHRIV